MFRACLLIWNLPLYVEHFHDVMSTSIIDPLVFWRKCLQEYEESQAPKLIGFMTIREPSKNQGQSLPTQESTLSNQAPILSNHEPTFTTIREKTATPSEERPFEFTSKHSPIQIEETENSQDVILCDEVSSLSVKPPPTKIQQTLSWPTPTKKSSSKKKIKIL